MAAALGVDYVQGIRGPNSRPLVYSVVEYWLDGLSPVNSSVLCTLVWSITVPWGDLPKLCAQPLEQISAMVMSFMLRDAGVPGIVIMI